MLTIVGSGFGLYGYLPALVGQCGERVVLPARYRPRFEARPELQQFAHGIDWVDGDDAALATADGAVLAVPPAMQPDLARNCLKRPNIRCLILEKPIAADPGQALALHDDLIRSGVTFRVGYIFRHTWWGERLRNAPERLRAGASLSIYWGFLAHHFRHDLDNWKRHGAAGGGAIRFFGIHLIALLAELGFDRIASSRVTSGTTADVESWRAVFHGPNLPVCDVVVNSRADVERFTITGGAASGTGIMLDIPGPFATTTYDAGLDSRVPVLVKLLGSARETHAPAYGWYEETIRLWSEAEAAMAKSAALRQTPSAKTNDSAS